MKGIIFTSARIDECKLAFDLIKRYDEKSDSVIEQPNNYKYEGQVTLRFTSSGDFSGMTEKEVSEIVLGKMLASGLFK